MSVEERFREVEAARVAAIPPYVPTLDGFEAQEGELNQGIREARAIMSLDRPGDVSTSRRTSSSEKTSGRRAGGARELGRIYMRALVEAPGFGCKPGLGRTSARSTLWNVAFDVSLNEIVMG